MFDRRSFLKKTGPAAAMASAAMVGAGSTQAAVEPPDKSYLVECVTFRLEFGRQLSNLLGWLEKRAMPLWQKHKFGPAGVFTVEIGPHIPAVFVMRVYSSLADRQSVWRSLAADPDWGAAVVDLEKDGPPSQGEDMMLLSSTAFSPPIKPSAASDPKRNLFELRIYESSTWKQLGNLHDRFAGGEIDIFHKSGIHPLFYADTLTGPNQPNMVYMVPYENAAAREAAWAKFRDDPEW
ncbi:MAG: NIPSNAP family protein, partial [Acidobacteria bacterium]|nr:NIPSNAP family protein [Acidobacteriota bacterium]